MRLTITPFTASDDEAVRAWCDVYSAANDHDIPLWRPTTPVMVRGWFAAQLPGTFTEGYTARVSGRPVATVKLGGYTEENLDTLEVDIRVVPQARRHGCAWQLHDFVMRRAQELGRGRLAGQTLWEPSEIVPGVRLADALGYKPVRVDVLRRLDVSTVDWGAFPEAGAEGYRLIRWRDEVPEEYLADLAHLESLIYTDSPMGDAGFEPPRPEPERMRRHLDALLRRGWVPFSAAMVHRRTGRMVACTTIAGERGLDWHVFEQLTVVDPAHRGHRLGLLLKVENLRALLEEMPGVRAVDTFTADANRHMIAINDALGFRPLYAFQNWQTDI